MSGSESPKPAGASRRTALIFGGALLIGVVAAVIFAVASGGEGDTPSGSLPEGCEEVDAPPAKQVDLKRPSDLDPSAATAVVATSCGSFSIALDDERAPKTAASFEYMIDQGVYDGTSFHRVVPNFVIQGGDPAADGTGGPGFFVDEAPPDDLSYTRGIVAMAKTEAEPPGRSGSQFFVVVGADAGLPPEYALLGEVSEGMDVVDRIASLGDEATQQPSTPIVIDSVTLDATG